MQTILKPFWLLTILFFTPTTVLIAQKQFILKSTNTKIEVKIVIDKTISYFINHSQDVVIETSPISILLTSGNSFGINPNLTGSTTRSINQMIEAPIYKKNYY